MIHCVIIEDEPLAADKIAHFVAKLPMIQLLAVFNSAIPAIAYLQHNPVDLIFLDIEIGTILYIEGMGDYRKIVTDSKWIMTLQTFGEIYDLLPKDTFCRVHNSYIVSLDKIEKIERNRIYIKNKIIPVSSSYSKEFYGKINV